MWWTGSLDGFARREAMASENSMDAPLPFVREISVDSFAVKVLFWIFGRRGSFPSRLFLEDSQMLSAGTTYTCLCFTVETPYIPPGGIFIPVRTWVGVRADLDWWLIDRHRKASSLASTTANTFTVRDTSVVDLVTCQPKHVSRINTTSILGLSSLKSSKVGLSTGLRRALWTLKDLGYSLLATNASSPLTSILACPA
jgi:hypothetical protein